MDAMDVMQHVTLPRPVPGERLLRLARWVVTLLAAGFLLTPLIRGTELSPNMLVAAGALAGLGALFVGVSLIGHMLDARDLASLEALFEETRRNLADAERLDESVGLQFERKPGDIEPSVEADC
jgi:hypothetical protein